jgi:hypothetical protein
LPAVVDAGRAALRAGDATGARRALERAAEGIPLLDEALAAVAGSKVDDFSVLEEVFCQLFAACEHAQDVGRPPPRPLADRSHMAPCELCWRQSPEERNEAAAAGTLHGDQAQHRTTFRSRSRPRNRKDRAMLDSNYLRDRLRAAGAEQVSTCTLCAAIVNRRFQGAHDRTHA